MNAFHKEQILEFRCSIATSPPGWHNKTLQTGWRSSRRLFSTPLEAGKSKSKLPVDGRPGEGSHSGLQSAALPPCGLPWVTGEPRGC